jgi:hypothetical protein
VSLSLTRPAGVLARTQPLAANDGSSPRVNGGLLGFRRLPSNGVGESLLAVTALGSLAELHNCLAAGAVKALLGNAYLPRSGLLNLSLEHLAAGELNGSGAVP